MQIFSHIFCIFIVFFIILERFSLKTTTKHTKKHLTFVGCFRGLRWCGFGFLWRFGVVRHVPCVHLGLEFGDFLIGYVGGFAVVIVGVLKEHREEVFDRLALTIAHGVHCSEHGFGDELVT